LKCFRNIEKTTFRFHFFKIDISEDQFRSFLEKEPKEKCSEILGSNYLGFIVVKPLMQTIIGRTCLKTYDESTDRHNLIRHRYNVNLFGIDLTVDPWRFRNKTALLRLAQTSALWSAFHATGRLFQHPIPSPSAITELATRTNPLDITAVSESWFDR
jgi:homospermidine synthase